MSDRQQKARDLFMSGYTCSQAVLLSFSDITGLEEATAGKMAGVFGGGMGGMRGTCGAVTGMFMVIGLLYGFAAPCDTQTKSLCYRRIRELAAAFEAAHGTLICRELLAGLPGKLSADPAKRDDAYYKARPCTLLVEDAVGMLEDYIAAHPVAERGETL